MNTVLRLLTASVTSFLILSAAGCGSEDKGSSEAAGHITRAETYQEQGQYRSALLEVRNALQKDPGNVDHVLVLADIYNGVGAGEQATDLLEPWQQDHAERIAIPLARGYILQGKHLSAREALEPLQPQSDTEQEEYDYLSAEIQRLSGNTDQAISDLRALQKKYPANPEITAALAKALLMANEGHAAVETLNQWTEEHGDNAEILFLTGLAHYRLGDVDKSTDILTEATSSIPTSDIFLPVRRQILTLLSRSLTEQGRISEAQVYNKILTENTNSASNERAESAIEAIQRGDLDTARTTLEELVQQNPDNERAAMILGTLNLQEGRTEDAESLLIGNIDAETSPTPLIRAATIAQIDSGKREEALATLSRAIKARPNDAELLAMHGIVALSLPDHKDAGVASLSKALELDRTQSRWRLALARHYMVEGQQEQSLAQMRVAFTETPTDWTVTQSYLGLLLHLGKETEAREVKESLLNGFSDEPPARMLAGIVELRLGEVETGLERLQKLSQETPESTLTHMALAAAYQENGDTQKAIETLVTTAALDPDLLRPLGEAARLYATDHTPEETIEWLKQVGVEHPELKTNSTLIAAQASIRQGKTNDARRLLESLPQDSGGEVVNTLIAELLATESAQAARKEDWQLAYTKASEAITVQPDNLNYALLPVRYNLMEGKTDEAMSALNDVESDLGEQPSTVRARAQILLRDERPEEALVALTEYYDASNDPAVLADLIQVSRQQAPERLDSLTAQWVESQPANANAHLSRADYLMGNGSEAKARPHYEKVLQLRPDHVPALNNLAWLLREDDLERALELAAQASELAPNSGAVRDTYGWLLHLDGQHERAVEQIERALALEPDNSEIQGHLEEARRAL